MVAAIREAGGEIFAVTSEPQSLATEAQETWEFGFPSVGDPHHEVLDTCRERGWLNLFVNTQIKILQARSWTAHPKGHFQPGVLALTNEGRVLYRWRSRPTRKNLGSAVARPTPEHVWAQVQSRLANSAAEPGLDDSPKLDAKALPWPLFVMMLLAHGWFVRPKVFALGRADEKPSATSKDMIPRIVAFIGIWIAAFVFLPPGWVALGLAAWGVFLWPRLAELHRGFQDVPTGEPDSI